jgi:hypothetical protein
LDAQRWTLLTGNEPLMNVNERTEALLTTLFFCFFFFKGLWPDGPDQFSQSMRQFKKTVQRSFSLEVTDGFIDNRRFLLITGGFN